MDKAISTKPIIGILLKDIDEENKRSTIPSPTAKYNIGTQFIHYLGPDISDIALIRPDDTPTLIQAKMDSISGVFLTGGTCDIYNIDKDTNKRTETTYAKAARIILQYAIQINKRGIHFPVFGLCLGFEAMIALLGEDQNLLEYYDNRNYNANLIYSVPIKESKILSQWGEELCSKLNTDELTINYHWFHTTKERFEANAVLNKLFKVVALSNSKDKQILIYQCN